MRKQSRPKILNYITTHSFKRWYNAECRGMSVHLAWEMFVITMRQQLYKGGLPFRRLQNRFTFCQSPIENKHRSTWGPFCFYETRIGPLNQYGRCAGAAPVMATVREKNLEDIFCEEFYWNWVKIAWLR